MDALLPATYAALTNDRELGELTSGINQFRQPENPAQLNAPVVVFTPRDLSDAPGLHGGAMDVEVEVSVWGKGIRMYPTCVQSAQRVSELMLRGLTLTGGGHTRWGEILGWQQIDQPNPEVVLLRNSFRCRYWSRGRMDTLWQFFEGFERAGGYDAWWSDGIVTAGTSVVFDPDATPPSVAEYWGGSCLEVVATTIGASNDYRYLRHTGLDVQPASVSFDIVVTSLAMVLGGSFEIFRAYARDGTLLLRVHIEDGNKFLITHFGYDTDNPALATDTLYTIKMTWDVESGAYAAYLDGTELYSGALAADAPVLDEIRLGVVAESGTGQPSATFYLDNILVSRA